MNRAEFFDAVGNAWLTEEITPIYHAYWLAKQVHRNQLRDEGGRYFDHCRSVAQILLDHPPVSANEVILALLHDCEEDGFIPQGLLEKIFGKNVANGVDILSKCSVSFNETAGRVIKKKKSLDRYFLHISRADRTIRRVKCADRIHNLSTMHSTTWSEERKIRYIAETQTYIMPIAEVTDVRLLRLIYDACRVR